MKRIMKFAGIIAASAALMVCCSKEASYDDVSTDPTTQNPADGQEDTNPSVVSGEVLDSFGVKFENDVNTKVSILIDEANAEATLNFVENDQVLVVSGSNTAIYVYDGTKFVPVVDPVTLDTNATVYYPASAFALSDGDVVFTMPAAVTSLEDLGAKNPLAAQLSGDDTKGYTATFKAVGSVLQVGVTGNRKLSSVVLSSGSNPIGEGTKYTVGWSPTVPTMAVRDGSSKSISISSSADLTGSPTTFYFILPAGITLTGVTATANLTTEDASGSSMFYIERNGDWTPVRKEFSTMSFYAGLFSGGTGTSEDPYIIAKARDFKNIRKYCNSGYNALPNTHFLDAHYNQTANIDFNNADITDYMIGSSSAAFTGTYDGQKNVLSNFTMNKNTGNSTNFGVAPFQAVNGGTLENIAIENASITGGKFTAGLVSNVQGASTIEKCSISSSTISSQYDYGAGGLIGALYGTGEVSDCTATDMTIKNSAAAAHDYFGGLISYINGNVTVSGCSLNGTTTITGTINNFGGIVGQTNKATVNVQTCQNNSSMSGNNFIGGIAGVVTLGKIDNCLNSGDISGAQYVGGIAGSIGSNSTTVIVSSCRSRASITGTSSYVGGIVGRAFNGSVVEKCFASGTITGLYDVGGIVGVAHANNNDKTNTARVYIYDCLSKASIVSTNTEGEARAGGFIGSIVLSNQYVRIDNCGVTNVSITTANTNQTGAGGFIGKMNSTNTTNTRCSIRNCYTLVASVPGTSKCGGFVGDGTSYGELFYCYYVADDSRVSINKNITKSNLTQTAADASTCTIFNNNTAYNLTITSTTYTSSLSWDIPDGCNYPVPGSLIEKGEEYYK